MIRTMENDELVKLPTGDRADEWFWSSTHRRGLIVISLQLSSRSRTSSPSPAPSPRLPLSYVATSRENPRCAYELGSAATSTSTTTGLIAMT